MTDTKLIAALETLTTLKANSYMKVRVELSEDEYKAIVANEFIKAYLVKNFPEQVKALDTWVATAAEDRDNTQKPFWPREMQGRMPQRVVWFYKDGERLKAQIFDAGVDPIDIADISECQAVTFEGALFPYNNPSTGYLKPVFVDGYVPPYRHELAVWQTEQGLNVMRSTEGEAWGKLLQS
ncbi:hypothetical protein pEaSNUABM11_00210 [Erwinia phage pEa_SNUABM_11]|nr:hypothetical protein pEaSNUABM11_00210 [Erwinia phage pEa_SNUABM_11]